MALMFVQITFLFVVVFLIQTEGPLNPEQSDVFIYISVALGLGAIVLSRFLKNNLLQSVKKIEDPEEKKSRYLTSTLVLLAIPEVAALFSIVAYWMSGDKFVLGIILLLLIIEGSQKPGPTKFKIDLELSDKDFDLLMQSEK